MISKSGIQLSIALVFGAVSVASAQNLDQARALLHAGADDAAIRTEVRVLQQLDEDDFLVEVDGIRIILDLDKAVLRNLTIGGIYEVIGELEKIRGEKYGVAV
ncbi:MAG: hypothetical protein LR015_04910, partial [Verrucomicrobia bacterium]|nr:hypothetical protein [Verrucomicrobiota bacterium]